MITWDPIYNDSTSFEYIQLSNHFCNIILLWANNSLPSGSSGGKCENVIFTPGNIIQYANTSDLGLNGSSTFIYLYENKLNVNADSLMESFKSVFQKSNTSSFLEIGSSTLTISIKIITEAIPLEHSTFNNIIRINLENVLLRNITSDRMVAWDPVYSDSTSHEYIQLSTVFCQLMVKWARNAFPLSSGGTECIVVTFSPADVQIYDKNVASGVNATLLLTLYFPHKVNVSKVDVSNGLKVTYETNRIYSFLQILYALFEGATDEVQPRQTGVEGDMSHTATIIKTSYPVISTTKARTTEASSSTTMQENPLNKNTATLLLEMTINNVISKRESYKCLKLLTIYRFADAS
ncbi:hypothetical protein MN116_008127 [Schistosoma mekongi]|uniref:Uncharacterized protein n=1 Tax=Schistosoma mekongi TaxID=38744 RepID=A0AAE1Z6R7_SCHME|nr:hypothetical protein MN116_008127 [Schistosoma mekongi]